MIPPTPGPLELKEIIAASLGEVEFHSAFDLFATYVGRAPDLQSMLSGAEINRDLSMRLQYLAGLSAHDYKEAAIFNEMLKYQRYPDDLFVGKPATRQQLHHRLGLNE